MAVAFQSATAPTWVNTGNTANVTLPTGTQAGDLLILCWAGYGALGFTTAPAGYVNIANFTSGGLSTRTMRIGYVIATATDVSNGYITYTLSANENHAMGIQRWTGHDTTTPVVASQLMKIGGTTTNVITPGIDPPTDCAFATFCVIQIQGNFSGCSMATDNPTWTEDWDVPTTLGTDAGFGAYHSNVRASGAATGDITITSSNSFGDSGGGIIAIQPPAATAHSTTLTESVVLVDTILKLPSRILSDVITLVSSVIKLPGKVISDTVTLVDSVIKMAGKVQADTITLVDTFIKAVTMRVLSETVVLVDTFTYLRIVVAEFLDSTSIQDTILKATSVVKADTITLVDTFTRQWNSFKTLTEEIAIVDTVLKMASKVMADAIALSDTIVRTATKVLSDTVSLVDTFLREMTRVLTETVTLVDTFTRELYKSVTFTEAITLVSSMLRAITNFVKRLPFIEGGRNESNFKTGSREDVGGIKGKKADGGMTGERF